MKAISIRELERAIRIWPWAKSFSLHGSEYWENWCADLPDYPDDHGGAEISMVAVVNRR